MAATAHALAHHALVWLGHLEMYRADLFVVCGTSSNSLANLSNHASKAPTTQDVSYYILSVC